MPCYTVNIISVEFKIANEDLLFKAINALGWKYTQDKVDVCKRNTINIRTNDYINFTLDLTNGSAKIMQTNQSKLNQLKQQYSKTVLEQVVDKKRWILKNLNNNKFEIRRY
jgi:hypothetical protein